MAGHTEGISFTAWAGFRLHILPSKLANSLIPLNYKFQIPLGINSQVRHLSQESCSEKENCIGSKIRKAGNSFVFATVR